MGKRLAICNLRFGLLVAEQQMYISVAGAAIWRCRCDCGGERLVTAAKLRSGAVTQCGCRSKRKVTRPDGTKSSTEKV